MDAQSDRCAGGAGRRRLRRARLRLPGGGDGGRSGAHTAAGSRPGRGRGWDGAGGDQRRRAGRRHSGLGARRVAMIAPYAPALTAQVIDYLADAGHRGGRLDQPRRHRQPGGRPARPGQPGRPDRPAGPAPARRRWCSRRACRCRRCRRSRLRAAHRPARPCPRPPRPPVSLLEPLGLDPVIPGAGALLAADRAALVA